MSAPGLRRSVLEFVGNTCMLDLGDSSGARILLKVEGDNPSGSIKDRSVLAALNAARADGALKPGAEVVEASSGNTAISLAVLGGALGHPVSICAPETISAHRRLNLEVLGVDLELTPAKDGMQGALDAADRRAREGAWLLNQFTNPSGIGAHEQTGAEIWDQAAGAVDALVAGVGTGATITGCGREIKRRNNSALVVAVEPAESAVLSGSRPGQHHIAGIGPGFIPPLLERSIVDETYPVPWWEAHEAVRELGREAGLFFGPSTGAVLIAARALARRLGAGATVVGIAADWGERNVETLGTQVIPSQSE